MKNFLIAVLVLPFLVTVLNAETFTTALSKAYKNNSELNAERENLNISALKPVIKKSKIKIDSKKFFIFFYIMHF